jgi:organic radical activating enzyme
VTWLLQTIESHRNSDPVIEVRTIGLALTLKCNFHCAHCITDAGLHHHDVINEADAFRLIEDISKHSKTICFTGGECILEKDLLLSCIKHSTEVGIVPTLVTNGHWAVNDDSTRRVLKELTSAGLKGICISMDRFHTPFADKQNAIRIAQHSLDFEISSVVRICIVKNDDFVKALGDEDKAKHIHFQKVRVTRLGRAKYLQSSLFWKTRSFPKGNCSTILAPIVLPDGKVQACCGPGVDFNEFNPLNVGDWKREDLGTILSKYEVDPLVMAISNFGPKFFTDLLKEHCAFEKLTKRKFYTGKCDLCIDICNNPEVVLSIREMLEDPVLRMRLVAGQVYQQSALFTKLSPAPEFA